MAPMMSSCCAFCCFEKKIGPSQRPPMFSLPCFPTTLVLKYIYIYILTLVLAMSPMYFLVPLVSFDIVYRAFNPQPFGDPYCPRKKFMSNLVPLVFLTCLFNTHAKLFVVILSLRCHFFIIIFIFLLFCIFSSSLALFACVYCC